MEKKEKNEILLLQKGSEKFVDKRYYKRVLKFKNSEHGLIIHFIQVGVKPQISFSALNEADLKKIQELLKKATGIVSPIVGAQTSNLVYEKPFQFVLSLDVRDRDDVLAFMAILKEVYPKVDFGLIDDLIGIDKTQDFKNLVGYLRENKLSGADEIPTLAAAFFNPLSEILSQKEIDYVNAMIASGKRKIKLRKRREGDLDDNPLTRSVLIDDKGNAYVKGLLQGAGWSGVAKRAINLKTGEVFIDKTQRPNEEEVENLRKQGILVTEIRRQSTSFNSFSKSGPVDTPKQHLLQIKIPGVELGKFLDKRKREKQILSLPERLLILIKLLEAKEPFLKAKMAGNYEFNNILWDDATKQCTFIDPYINPKEWSGVSCPTLTEKGEISILMSAVQSIANALLFAEEDPAYPLDSEVMSSLIALTRSNNTKSTFNLRTDVIEKLREIYKEIAPESYIVHLTDSETTSSRNRPK